MRLAAFRLHSKQPRDLLRTDRSLELIVWLPRRAACRQSSYSETENPSPDSCCSPPTSRSRWRFALLPILHERQVHTRSKTVLGLIEATSPWCWSYWTLGLHPRAKCLVRPSAGHPRRCVSPIPFLRGQSDSQPAHCRAG